jgi:hypothetical protein
MTTADDDFFDDLFLGCALLAFVEQATVEQGWPDCEATRRRAYRRYEDALAERNQKLDVGGSIGVSSGVPVD